MTTTASLHNRTVPHYLVFFLPKIQQEIRSVRSPRENRAIHVKVSERATTDIFFIKHIYSSFAINRYLQIQITSAFSSHKMDNYLKIYELTKTCSFFVCFFSTIMYSLYKINYKSLLPQTRA